MAVRTPLAKAKASGAVAKNPQRYRSRADPKVKPLGSFPKHFSKPQKDAWRAFVAELPWLAESDRSVLESACALRAKTVTEECAAADYRELRMHLSVMGATPVSRQNVTAPEVDEDDPWAAFQ